MSKLINYLKNIKKLIGKNKLIYIVAILLVAISSCKEKDYTTTLAYKNTLDQSVMIAFLDFEGYEQPAKVINKINIPTLGIGRMEVLDLYLKMGNKLYTRKIMRHH